MAASFKGLFGIGLSRGGACHAVLRAGRRCEGTCAAVVGHVRGSDRLVPDETGWRVGGRPAWLHAFAAPGVGVAYAIDPRRGHDGRGRGDRGRTMPGR